MTAVAVADHSSLSDAHSTDRTLIDIMVRLHIDRERVAFALNGLEDNGQDEAARVHALRCSRGLSVAQLRRIIRERWLDGHNCRLHKLEEAATSSASVDAARSAAAPVAATAAASALPAPLPDSTLLSSLWSPSLRCLSLHIPPFWPLTSDTVLVQVVPRSADSPPPPLTEREPSYAIYLSVNDLRIARVADLANQVRQFMQLDAVTTVDLLDANGHRLPASIVVATLIPPSQELRLFFECDHRLSPAAIHASMELPFVIDPSDMNLPLCKPRAPLTLDHSVDLPIRPFTSSMSNLIPSLSLPTPLAASILAFFPFDTRLAVLARVNREWHGLAYSPLLWTVGDARSWYIRTRAEFKDPHDAPIFFNRSAAAPGGCLTFDPPSLTLEEAGIDDGSTVDVCLDFGLF